MAHARAALMRSSSSTEDWHRESTRISALINRGVSVIFCFVFLAKSNENTVEVNTMKKATFLFAAILVSTPLVAQDAQSLSQFFEGKQVVVKIDMPGSQQGIDIYPQKDGMLDAKVYGKRMKSFPIALHNGDAVMVTTVKVKDKLIEFQLGGGGFGTFGDDTDTSVKFTPAPKSDREKELEDQLSNTDDPDQRANIQRELDYLRRRRERDDQRNKAMAEDAAREKKDQVDQDRMKGGSRFNLKYDGKLPANITPQDVMAALSQYVSFPPGLGGGAQHSVTDGAAVAPAAAPIERAAPAGGAVTTNGLQKGMRLDQVRALLGNPTGSGDTEHDGLQVHSETYVQGNSFIHADFVNGVLVRYSVDVH